MDDRPYYGDSDHEHDRDRGTELTPLPEIGDWSANDSVADEEVVLYFIQKRDRLPKRDRLTPRMEARQIIDSLDAARKYRHPEPEPCPDCDGRGYFPGETRHCPGGGFSTNPDCEACGGTGRRDTDDELPNPPKSESP